MSSPSLHLCAVATSTLVLCVLAACGSGDAEPADARSANDAASTDGSIDATTDARGVDPRPAPFRLTSTVITEGGVIPDAHSCQGANVSPPLAWTGGPTAPGYALIFTDITSAEGFLHSILWDIPGSAASLPGDIQKVYMPPVPAGSKQPLGYDDTTYGYLGPCPGEMHRYEFALHAVDVYPLPNVDMSSTNTAVRDAILAHSNARTTLTATFTPTSKAL